MALTLTHDWCVNGGTSQPSVTSASFTPAANSIICVRGSCYNGTGDDTGTIVISDTAGLTWNTEVIVSQLTDGAATNPPPIAIWTAQVGGSPVSMTVTTAVQDGVGFAHFQAGRIYTGHNVATPVIDTAQVIGTTGAVSMNLNGGAVTGCVAFAGMCDWGNSSDTPVAEAGTTTQCSLANADIQSSWAGFKNAVSGATTIGTQVLASPLGTNAVAILLQPADDAVTGVLDVTVPVFTVDFTGEATASGVLDVVLPVPDAVFTGQAATSGVLDVIVPIPAVDLTGVLSTTGDLDIHIPVPQVSLDGHLTAEGVLDAQVPVFDASFTGAAAASGQLDLVLPVPDVNLVGQVPVTGVLGVVLPIPTVNLTGTSEAGGQTMGPCGWTIPDPLCSDTWAAAPAQVKSAARDYAALVLWGATGREFGLCEVTVRPCGSKPCGNDLWNFWGYSWQSGTWTPYIFNGQWFNCVCPMVCCCEPRCQVNLPGDVDSIVEVLIDGIAVDPATYRVDDKHWLVRTGGECWPECPDMDAQEPTFEVTYLRGNPVPSALLTAAAILADEWAKACTGAECRLSNRVTSLARNGIQIEMLSPEELLDGNRTGLWEVDAVINAINPYNRVRRGQIYAPGRKVPRMTTSP